MDELLVENWMFVGEIQAQQEDAINSAISDSEIRRNSISNKVRFFIARTAICRSPSEINVRLSFTAMPWQYNWTATASHSQARNQLHRFFISIMVPQSNLSNSKLAVMFQQPSKPFLVHQLRSGVVVRWKKLKPTKSENQQPQTKQLPQPQKSSFIELESTCSVFDGSTSDSSASEFIKRKSRRQNSAKETPHSSELNHTLENCFWQAPFEQTNNSDDFDVDSSEAPLHWSIEDEELSFYLHLPEARKVSFPMNIDKNIYLI